jgi:hypothetical protein
MPPRGRPKKNGVKDPGHLLRLGIAICAYDKARLAGEKYSVALQAAVEAVRLQIPGTSMSETEMKRILAEFRPHSMETTLVFEESDNRVSINGVKHQRAWALRIGETPDYPRHNARVPGHGSKDNGPKID